MKNLVWRVWFWVKETWMHLSGRDTVSLTIRLKDLTYRRFERACLLVGLDPGRVRQGEQDLQEAEIGDVRDTGPELVRLLCRNDEVVLDVLGRAETPVAEHLCAQLLTRFFFSVHEEMEAADAVIQHYAERAGLTALLQKRGAGSEALGRELAALPPTEHERLVTMPLREALEYLGKQAVTDMHENIDEYM